MFRLYNILPVNADDIYRELTSKRTRCTEELAAEFGEDVINSDFSLNRKKLSDIVFSDREKLNKLNKITHSHVLCEVRKIISQANFDGYLGVVVDAPLLYESGFDTECDAVIAVIANEDIRIKRIVARDGITVEMAKKRIYSQLSDRIIASKADYIIDNTSNEADLLDEVEKIVNDIKNKLK